MEKDIVLDQTETPLELTPEEQAIADKASGKEVPDNPNEPNPDLPSDKKQEEDGDKKFAGKYETIEDLRKGIDSIGSKLPEYILDGMSDVALEKYYKDLEQEFHNGDDKPEGRKHAEEKDDGKDEKTDGDKPTGVSDELWTELSKQFEENGNITDEHYNKLNEAGIPDEVIDRYIDSIGAEQEKFTESIYSIAGGEEEYNIVKAWAEDNIPAEQIEAIGRMDKNGMLIAMEGIKAKYDAANPADGKRIIGDTGGNAKGTYSSQADYIIDVSDSRYGKDKRYTKAVDDKFALSKNLQ